MHAGEAGTDDECALHGWKPLLQLSQCPTEQAIDDTTDRNLRGLEQNARPNVTQTIRARPKLRQRARRLGNPLRGDAEMLVERLDRGGGSKHLVAALAENSDGFRTD